MTVDFKSTPLETPRLADEGCLVYLRIFFHPELVTPAQFLCGVLIISLLFNIDACFKHAIVCIPPYVNTQLTISLFFINRKPGMLIKTFFSGLLTEI